MDNFAYIFVERNFEDGNGNALPPLGVIQEWWFNLFVLPRVKQKLVTQEKIVETNKSREEFDQILAAGNMECLVKSFGKWAYGRKLYPDRECPDPIVRRNNRDATLLMYVIFGCEPLFSGRYRESFQKFVDECFSVAKFFARAGTVEKLKVEMPSWICKKR